MLLSRATAGSAPVAQLDRAPDYESGGQRFESFRARHFFQRLSYCRFGFCFPESVIGKQCRGCRTNLILRFRDGAVAQLGERVNGIHEVSGSIPLSSTNLK
jgi:hypothetical protein